MWLRPHVRCIPLPHRPVRLTPLMAHSYASMSASLQRTPRRSDSGNAPPSAVPSSKNRHFLRSRATVFTQLRTAARNGDMRKATDLMTKILEEKLNPNVYAFNDMLLACGKTGQVTKAFKLYNRLKKHGITPNQETFNYLINACAEAKGEGQFLERALWLKEHEMPKFNMQFRPSTYNVLLKCIANHTKQLDLLHSTLQEMKDRSIHPDLATYTTIISALGARGDALGALRMYEELKQENLQPDLRLNNALLHAIAKGGDAKALQAYFQEMREGGFSPDVRTYSIMLRDAYARGDYGLALAFLEEIQRDKLEPDVELCNALIRVGARAADGRAHVSRVLALMRRYRIQADSDTHHTLISAYALLKEPKLALSTFEDMKQRGFRPTMKSYTSLLVACRETGDADRAMEIFRHVIENGHEIDEVFMRVLRATLKDRPDLFAEAKKLQREAKGKGVAKEKKPQQRREEEEEEERRQAQQQHELPFEEQEYDHEQYQQQGQQQQQHGIDHEAKGMHGKDETPQQGRLSRKQRKAIRAEELARAESKRLREKKRAAYRARQSS